MSDYEWNSAGSNAIGRLVLSSEIDPGTVASLKTGETCAYEEDGSYVGNYSELKPDLRPKPSIVSWLMGKRAPERDHLFVSNGPHNIPLEMKGHWITGERGRLTAHMTVTIPGDTVGRLFPIARNVEGGEILPENLAEAVKISVGARFSEYVMSLNQPPTSVEELVANEQKFAQIADEELNKYGVNVNDAVLKYKLSRAQTAQEEQADADAQSTADVIDRQKKRQKGTHDFAGSVQQLGEDIGEGAIEAARDDPLAPRIKERLGRRALRGEEEKRGRDLDEMDEEDLSDRKVRKTRREAREKQSTIEAAKGIRDAASDGNGDEE